MNTPAWFERQLVKDASALSDNLIEQDILARQIADEARFARSAVHAIKAISQLDFTPRVAAQIAAVLSAQIAGASWSHYPEALEAMELLDSAHDVMGAA